MADDDNDVVDAADRLGKTLSRIVVVVDVVDVVVVVDVNATRVGASDRGANADDVIEARAIVVGAVRRGDAIAAASCADSTRSTSAFSGPGMSSVAAGCVIVVVDVVVVVVEATFGRWLASSNMRASEFV